MSINIGGLGNITNLYVGNTNITKAYVGNILVYGSVPFLLAGTSPDGKILKSIDDGSTWADIGSLNEGNPLSFIQLFINDNVLYTTDTGHVCNYDNSKTTDVSIHSIQAIAGAGENLYAFDASGYAYGSTDGTCSSFNFGSSGWGNVKNCLYINSSETIIVFSSTGIKTNSNARVQIGDFICGVYDSSDYIYAATSNGHVFKNTDAYDFYGWADLGDKTGGTSIETMLMNNNRIHFSTNSSVGYTDDNFSTVIYCSSSLSANVKSSTNIGNIILMGTDAGHIWKSTNDGSTWSDLGQQFDQTIINCLLSV